jgi:Calx-beta domain
MGSRSLLHRVRTLQFLLLFLASIFPLFSQAAPVVSISDVTVIEGNGGSGQAIFTVSLSEPFASAVIVSYATGDDPAGGFRATSGTNSCSPGIDYLGLISAVTLQGNTNSPPSGTIAITTCGDTMDEFDETFVVNLTSVTNGLQIADGQGRATIVDDDPLPSVRINDRSVTEGDDPKTPAIANFTVSLSAVSGKDVTIPSFGTVNGSALGGSACNGTASVDYITTSGGPLTITHGASSATINVPVCGDILDEANETYTVRLATSADNATVADSSGVGTIVDNDPLPALTVADVSAAEDKFVSKIVNGRPTLQLVNGSLPFVVSLSAASGRNVSFTYSTVNGSANGTDTCSQGGDFERKSSVTDSIPAGKLSKSIPIVTCADLIQELDETMFININTAANAAITDGKATGTIRNNDTVTGFFSIDPEDATTTVHEKVNYAYTWVVPDPQAWRALNTLDLRIRDDSETIFWVRWDEPTNTISLVKDDDGRVGPGFTPGSHARLSTSAAQLILADSSVVAGGPTAPDVTLNLELSFKPMAGGRSYIVEVAATDDLGNREDFAQAGTLIVAP